MSDKPLIVAEDIHRTYTLGKKEIEVLRGIDLAIQPGERVFLCGASGAGKTTLMYTLAGLERTLTVEQKENQPPQLPVPYKELIDKLVGGLSPNLFGSF